MPNWKETTLCEIADVQTGKNIPTSKQLPVGEYRIIGANGIIGYSSEYMLDGEYILTGRVGTIGLVNYERGKFFPSDNVLYIRANDRGNTKFLYYLLMGKNIKGLNVGSTQPLIKQSDIKKLLICVPPLEEQKKIAGILGSLDDKIELLRKENETLEKLAQTLFRKLFRESTNGTPVLAEDLIEFNPRESIDSSKEYLFFDMKCLSESSIAISDGIMRKTGSATHFRENDTLMAKITPCLENGKTGFVFDLHGNDVARGSTEFIVMRAKEGANPYFTYCLARDDNFRDYAIKAMTGTSGRQRVQVDLLRKFKINLDENSLILFGELCEPLFNKIENNIASAASLSELRDVLLPKLMRGAIPM